MSDNEPKKKKKQQPAAINSKKSIASSASSSEKNGAKKSARQSVLLFGGDGKFAPSSSSCPGDHAVYLSLDQCKYKDSIKIRGGSYGILMALYFHSSGDHCDGDGWMTKREICEQGQLYCRAQLQPKELPHMLNSYLFSAWNGSIERLEHHQLALLRDHRNEDRQKLWKLTKHGRKFAEELFQSRAADIVNYESPDGTNPNPDDKDMVKAREIINNRREAPNEKKKAPPPATTSDDKKPPAMSSSSIVSSPPVKSNTIVPKKEPAPSPTTTTSSNGGSSTPKKRKEQPSSTTSFFTAVVTPPSKQQRRRTSKTTAGDDE